jgi:hypothetical protein
MIKETRVDRWKSKTDLSGKLSAEEVFALIPKHFTNAERVEVLTPFANFWNRQLKELEDMLHYRAIQKIEFNENDIEFRNRFCIKYGYDIPRILWKWDLTTIMEMIYEKDSSYRFKKYTWKEIKENLNSFSELINKLSK